MPMVVRRMCCAGALGYGKENGIAWLTERTFELEQDDVEAVAAVAIGIVQADGYYLAFHDAGIAVFSLRDTRLQQALAAENPARAAVIPEMVATFVLYQQHEAVAEYLRQAGLSNRAGRKRQTHRYHGATQRQHAANRF